MTTKTFTLSLFLAAGLALSGCATRQEVMLAKTAPGRIATVAQSPEEGNSPEMTAHLTTALQAEGLQVRAPLPPGTRQAGDVDAVVSYVDVWRWDLVMYLQSISVRLFDARTGDLLVTGQWRDSALHGFRDAKTVVQGVVTEMMAKVRSAGGQN